MTKLGIRHEDKSKWEARVPLVPADVGELIRAHSLKLCFQASPTRAFRAADYERLGAQIADELDDCSIILGVKEIPPEKLEANKTYVYFSHTTKGQSANMPALRRLMELGCTLIDYEQIVDDEGRRLVFFGRFAGLAGMIDTLWALGLRLQHEGIRNPFSAILPAHRYKDLKHAERALGEVANAILWEGLPSELQPFVCGFAGYGQVSQGAQQVYDCLPVEEVLPEDLPSLQAMARGCYKVVFYEKHMVEPVEAGAAFDLQEYYEHPERYRAAFFRHVPHLTVLVNCIYWESKYPEMITRDQFRTLYGPGKKPRLRVIGDITCDVDGSLACTKRATTPDAPLYVYDPATDKTQDGIEGEGPVVEAVDFLPCELPVDASNYFSQLLRPFVPGLALANLAAENLADSSLPIELQRATIVYHGRLTEPYRYLEEFLT